MFASESNSQLATFRHMVGIHSTKGFAAQTTNQKSHFLPDVSHNNLHFDGRAAPNLGIVSYIQIQTRNCANTLLPPSSTIASATAKPKQNAATSSRLY